MTDRMNGTYTAQITATIACLYDVYVTSNGAHIMGSPYKAMVEPGPACASECTAHGLGLTGGISGARASFYIQARDQYGNNRTLGGDLFRVYLKGKWNVDEFSRAENSRKINGYHPGESCIESKISIRYLEEMTRSFPQDNVLKFCCFESLLFSGAVNRRKIYCYHPGENGVLCLNYLRL